MDLVCPWGEMQQALYQATVLQQRHFEIEGLLKVNFIKLVINHHDSLCTMNTVKRMDPDSNLVPVVLSPCANPLG